VTAPKPAPTKATAKPAPSKAVEPAAAKAAPKVEAVRLIGAEQFQEINELIFDTETDEVKFCTYWKVKTLEDLTEKQGIDAIAMLKKKAAALGAKDGAA
jgi:hypothetical protein